MTREQKINSLEDHIGYWLRSVSNHVSRAFAQKLADKNITVAEWVLLRPLLTGLADQNEQECFAFLSARDSRFLLQTLRNLAAHFAVKSIPMG